MAERKHRHWKVGELAQATGVTVRALHHYDELGLLVPSERTQSGYRLYGPADVLRLYRIVALRRLGLRLDEISVLLQGDGLGLEETVERQLAAVERQLTDVRRLRDRLTAIVDALEQQGEPSIDQLIDTMEAMTMHEKYYNPDQLQRLGRRREELGTEAIGAVQREWGEIFAALRSEMARGTNPTDARLDDYRQRAKELVHSFTGGDADIGASLGEMWANEDPAKVSHGMVDRELWDYYLRMCRT